MTIPTKAERTQSLQRDAEDLLEATCRMLGIQDKSLSVIVIGKMCWVKRHIIVPIGKFQMDGMTRAYWQSEMTRILSRKD